MDPLFNEIIKRENTGCAKYDQRKSIFGTSDVMPFWVADMDFRAPEAVIENLKKRVGHGIFGYPVMPEFYFDPIVTWTEKRYGWKIEKEWICFSPGVVPALAMAVVGFSRPGDGVIVQPPVYFPFYRTIEGQSRKRIENPLQLTGDRYEMDFENLEREIGSGTKMIFLCNPHNPGGRVWKKRELERLGEICLRNDILIVSDEIHSDIIYKGHRHIPVASIDRDLAQHTITCMAPSKTFNLAGLATSFVIIPDPGKRNQFRSVTQDYHIHHGNVFGLEAMKAAYTLGEEWLDSLLVYLEGNSDFIAGYVSDFIPEVKIVKPEGTCLTWLDFRDLNMTRKQLNDFLIHKAGIGMSDGELFGTGGQGFQRLNFACPRSLLKKGLEKIKEAIQTL